jgi:DNA-directed RNA polymerase subunit alpha
MTTDDHDLLAAPRSVLGLTLRSHNALLNNGFSTVGDLLARTETELAELPLIGPKIVADIKAKLSSRGLTLHPGGSLPSETRP